MFRRLGHGLRNALSGHQASNDPVAAAKHALKEWENELIRVATADAGDGSHTLPGFKKKKQELAGDAVPLPGAICQVEQVLGLTLAVPPGPERDGLVTEVARLLQHTQIIPSGAVEFQSVASQQESQKVEARALGDRYLNLLRSCSVDDGFKDALVLLVSALLVDPSTDESATEAASSAPPTAPTVPASTTESTILAWALKEKQELDQSQRSCRSALDVRQGRLAKADAAVQASRCQVKRRVDELAASCAKLQATMDEETAHASTAGTRVKSMEDECKAIESEVNELEQHKRDLRAELDRTSMLHNAAVAKQRQHMSQVDHWRHDCETTKDSAAKTRTDAESRVAMADKEMDDDSVFLAQVASLQSVVLNGGSAADEEAKACMDSAGISLAEGASHLTQAAEDRLQAALAHAQRSRADHRSARQRLQMLEVSTRTEELPTHAALARDIGTLQDAWASRVTLGDVDLRRRVEMDKFLADATDECQPLPEGIGPLAEAKAGWAVRWASLGDLGSIVAAAGGGGALAAVDSDGCQDSQVDVSSALREEDCAMMMSHTPSL